MKTAKRRKLRTRDYLKRLFESLQFIDDCNSVVHGSVKDMDRSLGQAAEEFKLKWDRSKDWKNGVHLGVNLDRKRHQRRKGERSVSASKETVEITSKGEEKDCGLSAPGNITIRSGTA